jgi:uncharacterized protein YbbK (DUF523 family)
MENLTEHDLLLLRKQKYYRENRERILEREKARYNKKKEQKIKDGTQQSRGRKPKHILTPELLELIEEKKPKFIDEALTLERAPACGENEGYTVSFSEEQKDMVVQGNTVVLNKL